MRRADGIRQAFAAKGGQLTRESVAEGGKLSRGEEAGMKGVGQRSDVAKKAIRVQALVSEGVESRFGRVSDFDWLFEWLRQAMISFDTNVSHCVLKIETYMLASATLLPVTTATLSVRALATASSFCNANSLELRLDSHPRRTGRDFFPPSTERNAIAMSTARIQKCARLTWQRWASLQRQGRSFFQALEQCVQEEDGKDRRL